MPSTGSMQVMGCQQGLLFAALCILVSTPTVSPSTTSSCRDRTQWPFASNSIWNTPIGSHANFVPANIYAAKSVSSDKLRDICANETVHPSTRHTCPGEYNIGVSILDSVVFENVAMLFYLQGNIVYLRFHAHRPAFSYSGAHGGITPSQCQELGCCFSASPEPDPHGCSKSATFLEILGLSVGQKAHYCKTWRDRMFCIGTIFSCLFTMVVSIVANVSLILKSSAYLLMFLRLIYRYPWCFTPSRVYGPSGFHNDAEYWVITSESDPIVEWVDQG